MNPSTSAAGAVDQVTLPAARTVTGLRATTDAIARWLAIIGVIGCALQIAFAALGFWGAEEQPGNEAAGKAAFAPHAANGNALGILAVLLLIAGLITMTNRASWIVPIVIVVLIFGVQGPLVGLAFDHSRWFGGLHALIGTGICAGFVWLACDRWLHPLRSAAGSRPTASEPAGSGA
jgi:uncharacterized membrane protein